MLWSGLGNQKRHHLGLAAPPPLLGETSDWTVPWGMSRIPQASVYHVGGEGTGVANTLDLLLVHS